jgi:hypothetical protein
LAGAACVRCHGTKCPLLTAFFLFLCSSTCTYFSPRMGYRMVPKFCMGFKLTKKMILNLFTPFLDTCAEKYPLMSMWAWAEGLACADPGINVFFCNVILGWVTYYSPQGRILYTVVELHNVNITTTTWPFPKPPFYGELYSSYNVLFADLG